MEYVSDGTSSLLSEVRVHGSATEENTDALRTGNIDNILDIKPCFHWVFKCKCFTSIR